MLNRRYLRIKTFQALYAYWQGDGSSAAKVEKELVNGLERTYDLFLSLLLVFGELRHIAELRIEARKNKRMPTAEDLSPNRRFVDNPFIKGLAESDWLRQESEKRRISWVGEQELFAGIFRDLEMDASVQAYLALGASDIKKDQQFVIQVFVERVVNSETLQEVIESRNIAWVEDLDLAAAMVKRALEQSRTEEDIERVLSEAMRDPQEDRDFVSMLFQRTIALGEENEQAIASKSSNWESDRIALSDMILMKMALTEVRIFEQIPVKVTMNEYIEVAKAYSTPKSKNFINGVLDKLFTEMRSDGRIRKVGRGLLES